jgi:glutamine kinase
MKDSSKQNKTIFTSKSNVLKFLQNKVKTSQIEKIYDFTVREWESNNNLILLKIQSSFSKHKVIVRSSAMGEDSDDNSQAGSYESILNINSNSKKQLDYAITKVIQSYSEKNNHDKNNQILVQTQTQNIISSGVVFTRTINFGSPYFVINYEEGESTVGVTHGLVNQTIKILKNTPYSKIPKKWKLLVKSIKELEFIFKNDSLDIEFGITKHHKIIIFQVRPITSLNKSSTQSFDSKIFTTIKKNSKKYSQLKNSKLPGKLLIFSDMTDWNPAEIIGNNPHPLDYSLYDLLIMKDAWYLGRLNLGYRNFTPHSLMKKFGNKPYVDTKISFNSMIPKEIGTELTNKLMNYYLTRLHENPHLHDKVEFEILFTCFDLSLSDNLEKLHQHNFSDKEILQIYNSLLKFTKNILTSFPKIAYNCKSSVNQMSTNREIYAKSIKKSTDYKKKLQVAEFLLHDCKNLGTIPFSTMARIAFIAAAFLQSFVKKDHLTQKFVNNFMNSLNTPLSKFQNDLIEFSNGKISKNQFLHTYGHLRPGTYDITIERYDKENPFLQNIHFNQSKTNEIKYDKKNIQSILNSHDLQISHEDFFKFIHDSLTLREEQKFEFTHNLSDALELISEASRDLGFFREEIAFLDINYIFKSYKHFSKLELKKVWKEKIILNKKNAKINDFLVLPPIISSLNDFELIEYHYAKPNYITTGIISTEIIFLQNLKNNPNIENKIILLEHADPGFDWIFTKNPAGLITKYGGVASHMSIRCSEVSLPAAIGCGEIIFEQLQHASKIMLDCKNNQILVLEHEQPDEFSEQKKVLKSLGYIK